MFGFKTVFRVEVQGSCVTMIINLNLSIFVYVGIYVCVKCSHESVLEVN